MASVPICCSLLLFFIHYLSYHNADASCSTTKEQKFVKIAQAGLPEVNPFKTTTVTSATFCSFDCTANEPSCKSYVYLKSKALDNCLLSRDLNGESSSEDSETYASQIQQPSADEDVCNHNNCQRGSECTESCTSPFYKCQCPPWASGLHCENLNPQYDISSIPWTQGPGGNIRTVDSWHDTFIATFANGGYPVYFLENNKWTYANGWLGQVSVGETEVWGVGGGDNAIYYRDGTGWANDASGLLSQVSAGKDGIVWGYESAYFGLYYKSDNSWKFIGQSFKWASCGKYGCWAVATDGSAMFRTGVTAARPDGVDWVNAGGSFKQLDSGPRGEVYAVDNDGQVYTREGVTQSKPEGEKWSMFGDKKCTHVSVGDKSVFAVAEGLYYTFP